MTAAATTGPASGRRHSATLACRNREHRLGSPRTGITPQLLVNAKKAFFQCRNARRLFEPVQQGLAQLRSVGRFLKKLGHNTLASEQIRLRKIRGFHQAKQAEGGGRGPR